MYKEECRSCNNSFEVDKSYGDKVGCKVTGGLVWRDHDCENFVPESVDRTYDNPEERKK